MSIIAQVSKNRSHKKIGGRFVVPFENGNPSLFQWGSLGLFPAVPAWSRPVPQDDDTVQNLSSVLQMQRREREMQAPALNRYTLSSLIAVDSNSDQYSR